MVHVYRDFGAKDLEYSMGYEKLNKQDCKIISAESLYNGPPLGQNYPFGVQRWPLWGRFYVEALCD